MSHLSVDYLSFDLFTCIPVKRTWGLEPVTPGGGSCMLVPFRGTRSKGVGYDGTSYGRTFLGGIGREEGRKE